MLDAYGPPPAATQQLSGLIAMVDLADAACVRDYSHLTYFAQQAGAAGLVLLNEDEQLRTLTPRAVPFEVCPSPPILAAYYLLPDTNYYSLWATLTALSR